MLRHARWLATAIGISLALVSDTEEAFATTTPYAFPPLGQFGFKYNPNSFPNSGNNVIHWCENGNGPIGVCNQAQGGADFVSGALGMGPGGSVTFSVQIGGAPDGTTSTAGTIQCTVNVTDIVALTSWTFTNSGTVAHGAVTTFQIGTSVPAGASYAYSADCYLPGASPGMETRGWADAAFITSIQATGSDPFLAPAAGAGFVKAGFSSAPVSIVGGAITPAGGTDDIDVEASLGTTAGGATAFQIWGVNPPNYDPTTGNNKIFCSIFTGLQDGAYGGFLTTQGPGYFTITTSDPVGGLGNYFLDCYVPPGAKLFGVVPQEYGMTYLGPVMGSAFTSTNPSLGFLYYEKNLVGSAVEPVSPFASATQTVYASLGHAGGGATTFSFFDMSPGVTCKIWALDQATGISTSFGGTTNWGINATINVTANVPTGATYFYSAECVLLPQGNAAAYLGGVYPASSTTTAVYDWDPGNQCTVGGVQMHCCPTGYVMIGANASQNCVFRPS